MFVDTVAPLLTVTAPGLHVAGSPITLRLKYRDAPAAGLPAVDASGVASLAIRWGDGTITHLKPGTHRLLHSYRRAGRYKVTVTVADRAGNQTKVIRRLQIKKPAPRRKPATRKKHG